MSGNLAVTIKHRCSICDCQFDLEAEGGVVGSIGIIPVNFCPTCKAGVMDFAEQMRLPYECPKCGHLEGEDDYT